MIRLHTLIYTVFFFLGCSRLVVGQEKTKTPKTIKELQAAIEKVLKETDTPAAGIALVQGDSTIWVAGLGKTNRQTNAAATENTMFRIGSVSKMFVSLAILKLQEEGRLNLKDKVHALIPEIEFKNPWSKTAPILVEHLLEHTTGWDDIHFTEYALDNPRISLKQALDFHPHSRTSRWMPGTRMAYCNAGPPVAAYIIEKITGQPFEDYVQQHFFRPMGMETMTFFATESYKRLGATLYLDQQPQPYWNISMRPSGAINASPRDMAKMLRFFINRGRAGRVSLISEASLKRMETPSSSTGAKAGLEYGYGLTNYSSPHKRFVYRSHTGGVLGGLTDFSYLPDQRVGYAVMINAGNGPALLRIVDLIRNFQTDALTPDSIPRSRPGPIHELAVSGYYIPINPRIQLSYFLTRILDVKHIWTKGNFIFLKGLLGGWPETYLAINDHQSISRETGKISLVQVKDPIAGTVVHRGSEVLMAVSPLLAFGQLILGGFWILYLAGSALLGSIWFIRYWRGKFFSSASLSIGLWPFIASLSFLAAVLLESIGFKNPFELLGKVSFVSVSLMVMTIFFALASLGSVINVIRLRNAKINRTIYWHLAILAGLHLIVACYLGWHGVIGIQTWT